MKNPIQAISIFCFTLVSSILIISCSKVDPSPLLTKEEGVPYKWLINRVQLNIFTNGVLVKDTIIPRSPKPSNYIDFKTGGNFEYRFNTNYSNFGTYQLAGADSIIAVTPTFTYKFKILTLTNNLLTTCTTSTNHPSYPGSVVQTYHTLIR